MTQVYFRPQSVPRTTTRDEWYKGYRRFREMRRESRVMNDHTVKLLASHKDMPARIRRHIIDRLIYPPLILGPWM